MAETTVRSRRLARILADARKAAGKTQGEAARYVGRTTPWLSRNETAATCRISVGDVRSLLDFYGVTDQAEVERVVDLARQVREPGWWAGYDLSAAHAMFVAFEAEASAKRAWEPSLIPGLLQTPDYARFVIEAGPMPLPPERVEALIKVRGERQRVLRRQDPLVCEDVIDEAALRRIVGGPRVMRQQLAHLLEAAHEPNVSVRVLPFAAGAHPACTGPFTILEFPGEEDSDVMYTEGQAGGMYVEDAAALKQAHQTFGDLVSLALGADESAGLIEDVARSL